MLSTNELPEMQLGEGFAGSGAELAHINTVLGVRSGPVGVAWATALATPRAGHTPFVVVLQPGLAVKPFTLFANKASITGDRHGSLTWGAAQAGVATGVTRALIEKVIRPESVDALALIAAVWVSADAEDPTAVFQNNAEATLLSLRSGANEEPELQAIVNAVGQAHNPYFAQGNR